MNILKAPLRSKSFAFERALIENWNRAEEEYFGFTNLQIDEQNSLLRIQHSSEVVIQALESKHSINSQTEADKHFVAAVASAGTHPDIVGNVSFLNPPPSIIIDEIATLLRFAHAIDQLLEFILQKSPGAFVFGAVRVMITVAVKNMELLLTLKGQFEKVKIKLHRLDVVLALKNPEHAITSQLARVLIDVVRFCGQVTKYINEYAFGQPAKLKEDIEAIVRALDQDTILEHPSPFAELNESNLIGIVNSWLQPALVTEHETFLNADHYLPGTGQWLQKNEAFRSWVEHRSMPQIWIHGLTGSGKSVLAAHTMSTLQEDNSSILAFFFCNRDEPSKRSASSVIRTILSQLVQQSPRILRQVNKLRLEDFNFNLPQSPLAVWRQVIVDDISEAIYIVIDGLDECPAQERKFLMDIIVSSRPNTRISWLIFSRYLPDIASSLVGPNLVLRPTDNRKDMAMYVEQYVNKSRLLGSTKIRQQVIDTLSKTSTGIFLWVKLILQELEKQKDISGVAAVLQSPPLGMENLYQIILQTLDRTLNDQQSQLVSAIFNWVACASRPLTVIELTEAIRLSLPEIGETSDINLVLKKNCSGLVSVSSTGLICFIHETFHQYILSDRCQSQFAVNRREMHTKISKIYLSYLSGESFSKRLSSTRFQTVDISLFEKKYPLLSYAALYWPEHVDSARAEQDPHLLEQLTAFVSSNNLLTAIELVVIIDGIDGLQRWMSAFSNIKTRFPNTVQYEQLNRFISDFKHLIRHYGHVLDKFPSEIHYLIDESFPSKSHFWEVFGHKQMALGNSQIEEWDPLFATLEQREVTCIAVSSSQHLAAADKAGVSIWNLQLCTEITRISLSSHLVIAITFNDDTLAILTQDGTLSLVSTQSWQVRKALPGIVYLPTLVQEWDGSLFWGARFRHLDPLHINLNFVGKGLLAGNTLLEPETGRRQEVMQNMSLISTISNLICTRRGELIGLSPGGELVKRKLGSSSPSLERSEHIQAWTRRLLAVSSTGRFVVTCAIKVHDGFSISENSFECLDSVQQISVLKGEFGNDCKITAAAISTSESTFAVTAYNAQTRTDITKMWTLVGKPQLIWERTTCDDYTTSIAFGIEDTILVKAGRLLRVWDITTIDQSKQRDTFELDVAIKLSRDGKQIAAVPVNRISGKASSLILQATDHDMAPVEIIWPPQLRERNTNVIDPLTYSADGALIAWDHAVFSTETRKLVGAVPLSASEQICHVGGFTHQSSIAVYGVEPRFSGLRPQDLSIQQLDNFSGRQSKDDAMQQIIGYNWMLEERQLIFSTFELSIIQTHPSQPLVGFVAKSEEAQWTAYIYDISLRQFATSIPLCVASPYSHFVPAVNFSTSGTFSIAYLYKECKEGGDFQGLPTSLKTVRIPYEKNTAAEICSNTCQTRPWYFCYLLPSEKIVYFFRDGWIMIWDRTHGLSRVKYLYPQYQWSNSAHCTAVAEVGSIIRVAAYSFSMGLLWFDIITEELNYVTMDDWIEVPCEMK